MVMMNETSLMNFKRGCKAQIEAPILLNPKSFIEMKKDLLKIFTHDDFISHLRGWKLFLNKEFDSLFTSKISSLLSISFFDLLFEDSTIKI